MLWESVLGSLAVLVVAVVSLGGVVYVALLTLVSGRVLPAAVTLALVAAVVLVLALVGSRRPDWLSNPYW